eukprot:scaffold45960_cov30-Attheya_sp.AAC.1
MSPCLKWAWLVDSFPMVTTSTVGWLFAWQRKPWSRVASPTIQRFPDCERKGGLTIWLVTHFDGMFTIIVIHTVDSMHRKYYILLREI